MLVQRTKCGACSYHTNKVYAKKTDAGSLVVRARCTKGFSVISKNSSEAVTDETQRTFDISVSYLPPSSNKTHIAIFLSQHQVEEGCVLRSPMLCVSALLPKESEVFQVIENGDLNRLHRMLWTREASLNDRDTSGRCLLNVSIKFVRFLFSTVKHI